MEIAIYLLLNLPLSLTLMEIMSYFSGVLHSAPQILGTTGHWDSSVGRVT